MARSNSSKKNIGVVQDATADMINEVFNTSSPAAPPEGSCSPQDEGPELYPYEAENVAFASLDPCPSEPVDAAVEATLSVVAREFLTIEQEIDGVLPLLGVPIPKRNGHRRPQPLPYAIDKIPLNTEAPDGIFISGQSNEKKVRRCVQNYISRCKRHGESTAFTVRVMPGGVGVWRIK